MQYTIEAAGLRKAFGDLQVLDGLDLQVAAGTMLALLGPNGAGKTTTVRILTTLVRPDAGRATVAGHDVATDPAGVRAAISLTGQYASVDEVLTGRENLELMGRLRHLGRRAARRRCDELLEQFDLAGAARRRAGTYSGGMRRRLDLAMSLVGSPRVLFLDEPTTGLDPRSRRDVWDTVAALRASGVTILLTTQYLEEADALADRIVVVDGGRAVAAGTAAELKAAAGAESVALFFASAGAVARAAAALGGLADPDALAVHVTTDGSADGVRAVLDRMAAADLGAERVELRRPSLDEVFLSLTERPVVGAAAGS
jgi:ABC-2 type transport system ATP-binding protein